MDGSATAHFERKRPGWFTRRVFNPAVAGLTRLGISLFGSRVLEVTGRISGEPSSELTTYCPYKDEASYYSINADAERGTDAVWFYADPHPAVAEIKGYVVFYADRAQLSVEEAED